MSFRNVVEILQECKDHINLEMADMPDSEHHRLKLQADLNRNIEYINLLTGIGDTRPDEKVIVGPATTMGGQPIKRPPAKITSEDLEPEPRKVVELKARVEALWHTFVTRDSKEILKEVDDTTIRGVAKKAKMKVTKDDPEVITLQFVEEVKDAILMEKARIIALQEQANNAANQPQAKDIDDELGVNEPSTSHDFDDDIDPDTTIEDMATELEKFPKQLPHSNPNKNRNKRR